MASFTGVGDSATLSLTNRGDRADVALSGTYDMTIALQREQGSPGSGSWETLKSWDTADATVAYAYYSGRDNENLRLIVLVDNSGTCTATLTDTTNLVTETISDPLGNVVFKRYQDGVEFFNPDGTALVLIDSEGLHLNAGLQYDTAPIVDCTAATLAVTAALHAGKWVTLNRAGGITVTLPAATGTGNEYKFFVGTTFTSDGVIQVADATDAFYGALIIATDIAGVVENTAANDDTITMNGTTTGGVKGSWLRFYDVGTNLWAVEGQLISTGSEATPYSAGV